jgi:succinate-acetate transporter protein
MATTSEPQAAVAPKSSGWTPANPAPLGLCGFGITTLVLSVINANLVSASATPVVLGLAIAYGGTAQLLAGMWEFRTGNVFGAVAFTSYGAFWISFFFLVTFDAKLLPATEGGAAVGLYLWAWAIFTGMMFLCSFNTPRAVQLVFLLLTITFVLLGIGNSGGTSSMVHAGGYFGLATAAAALYTAAGEIMAASYGRDVLPLGRPSR